MKDKYYCVLENEYGTFTLIESDDNFITGVYAEEFDVKNLIFKETKLLKELKEQLTLYFRGNLKKFTVPFNQNSTSFQKEVYDVLVQVPYGYTITYGDIAYLIGKEKGSRAVGNALGKNNLLILVPCHRVVSKTSLGGFSSGMELKEKLLKLEGVIKNEKI